MTPSMQFDDTGYQFYHVAAVFYKQSDQALLERLGLGLSQLRILSVVLERPAARQRELADALGQTEASISRQIKLLCERGLLVMRVNPKSRRQHAVAITPKGTKIAKAASEVLAQYYDPLLRALSEKERQNLTSMLGKMHASICASDRLFTCQGLSRNN